MIHGHPGERAQIASLVRAVREGHSQALLVEGPPGIGKSTLLAEAVAQAGDLRVLRAQGFESEREIPYAGLFELLLPVLDLAAELPENQRRALHGALAIEAAPPRDRFSVPVAVLSLLGAATEQGPVLVLADDVQWLDDASREALFFVARRALHEGLGVLLAARDSDGGPIEDTGIERLGVGALDEASARAVLAHAAGELAPEVAEAIVGASAGNPLALEELPRLLSADQRAGRAPLAAPLGTEHALQQAFARRLDELPEPTQVALCAVAAAAGAPRELVVRALDELHVGEAALTPAARDGLLGDDADRLTLRHPLLAAAAYHSRPSSERRAVHVALAAVAAEPGRRGWHLSAAASGPDAVAAEAMQAAGEDARGRGAHGEAARAFARAAELSGDVEQRAARGLQAAIDAMLAGDLALAARLGAAAGRESSDPQVQLQAEMIGARVAVRTGDPTGGRQRLEALATQLQQTGQGAMAAVLQLEAATVHMVTGDTEALLDMAVRAREQAEAAGAAEVATLAVLVSGETLLAVGRTEEGERLLAATEPLLDQADPLSDLAELIGMAASSSLWVERFDRAERITGRMIEIARDAGAAARLPYPLDVRSQLNWRRGHWAAAYADAEESVRLARETGQLAQAAVALPALVRAEAGLGRLDAARAHGAEGLVLAERAAGEATVLHVLAALGFLEISAGRPDDAIAWLQRAAEIVRRRGYAQPALALFAGDHVEALIRAGRREEAEAELGRLAAEAQSTGGAWANAVTERCRALLAPDGEVEAHAARAMGWHDRVDMPFERARTELVLGERLRRARRRADARGPLERALEVFERLGAEPWAARTRTELTATGGAYRTEHEVSPADELTPHELQVALLVADGLTNREVAAALFLSPKTIEHHLSIIYRKLGLRSRAQLAALLASERATSAIAAR
jgi:DNA-binding CsgD family transcriptional regulator